MQSLPPGQQHGTVLLAECQTAGRGRRGRSWVSPPARNIYFSLGWRFDASIASLVCLPLVVALATCRSLASAGLEDHAIKWPNDIVIGERKLGGCLVEIQADAQGSPTAVIGIGINVHMPVIPDGAIDQPWTDLARWLPDVSRNQLATALICDLFLCINLFSDKGFRAFEPEWSDRDALSGKEVVVIRGTEKIHGVSQGISNRGGLLLETARGIEEFHSGEVSVRSF
jgi:BirA family biotin operon repressor/biotin-[acetyl-CoA-carboxylase] ligase